MHSSTYVPEEHCVPGTSHHVNALHHCKHCNTVLSCIYMYILQHCTAHMRTVHTHDVCTASEPINFMWHNTLPFSAGCKPYKYHIPASPNTQLSLHSVVQRNARHSIVAIVDTSWLYVKPKDSLHAYIHTVSSAKLLHCMSIRTQNNDCCMYCCRPYLETRDV